MLLSAVVLAIFVFGVISSLLGSMLPTLGFTGVQNGTLALTQATGLAIGAFSAGPLIDSTGKKTAMVAGLASLSCALWLMPNAVGNWTLALALWFLLGLGGGMLGAGSNSLLSDIGGAKRSSVMNFSNVFFGVGLMITPFLASKVDSSDARGLCYFGAVLATIMVAVHALVRMPPPDPKQRFNIKNAAALAKSPALMAFAAMAFLYVATEVGVSNWLVKYLIAKGMARVEALRIMSFGFAFGLLSGRVAASWILNRVSSIKVVFGGAVLMTLTTLWVLMAGGDGLVVTAAVFCAGFAMGPVYPTTLGMVGDTFPGATGTAIGLVSTSGWIGLAVSSRLIGVVAGADESHLPQALLIFPIFSALLIGISLIMRKTAKGH